MTPQKPQSCADDHITRGNTNLHTSQTLYKPAGCRVRRAAKTPSECSYYDMEGKLASSQTLRVFCAIGEATAVISLITDSLIRSLSDLHDIKVVLHITCQRLFSPDVTPYLQKKIHKPKSQPKIPKNTQDEAKGRSVPESLLAESNTSLLSAKKSLSEFVLFTHRRSGR